MTALPAELRSDLRAQLRANAGKWIARFYRHEILVARTVKGMQIEAQQEFNRTIVQPLLREIGGRLSIFYPRGNDVVAAIYPEIRALESEVSGIIARGSDAVRRLATERLEALTRHEGDWVKDSARKVLGIEPVATTPPPIAPVDRPVLGLKVEEWYRGMLDRPTGDKVRAWIQTGIQSGLTTDEIVRGLRGTPTQAGILEAPRAAVAGMVRAQATAVSAQARFDSFARIGVDKWRWLATLDTKTCVICGANEEGSPYDVGKGPTFPAHPNCRCSPVPWFGEPMGTRPVAGGDPVEAGTSFPQWLESQSASAQREVLGSSKAAAFQAGKLPFDKMLGRDLQPLTLAELRRLDRIE